ncbi:MBL fold metallo-hydrolase [Pseudovibrio sp. Alg231-02]|uniref:MBL fold metallo-hydrolase n=1 Tax=Pseudovibrio sp. Alg231-02 TaxID=1922223 RepID=UPI000D54AF43|nr:MBL fold metallo-hydrolase [Pseudovibrio sp. Alg231-02]
MNKIYADLWQVPLEKRFGTLLSHAYFLKTPARNILISAFENLDEAAQLRELGGVNEHYLTHNHEISEGLSELKFVLGSTLIGHENIQKFFSGDVQPDLLLKGSGPFVGTDGFQAIYTPGHTDNNLCFYYPSPTGKNYLFTGDTIYLDNGRFKTLIMSSDGGNKQELVTSLKNLRDLPVDVIFCSVAMGNYEIVEVTQPEWHALMDEKIAELER